MSTRWRHTYQDHQDLASKVWSLALSSDATEPGIGQKRRCGVVQWHSVCAANRHPMGRFASVLGLRQRYDLLAAPA